jgi:hypothetical protein
MAGTVAVSPGDWWAMRPGKRQAIRLAFSRLGLHTTPQGIVAALAQQGVQVDEGLVRQVRFEVLKGRTRRGISRARPVPPQAVRRRPRGFPQQ